MDRVGRYFPLTLVWEVPEGVHPLIVTRSADPWFDQVEQLLLDTLAEEHVDLEKFDQRLIALPGRELDRVPWTPTTQLDPSMRPDPRAALAPSGSSRWASRRHFLRFWSSCYMHGCVKHTDR